MNQKRSQTFSTSTKTTIRFAFFGHSLFSRCVLDSLCTSGFWPSLIITKRHSLLERWADEHDIPSTCVTAETLDTTEFLSKLRQFDCQLFTVAGFMKLPSPVFSIPQFGSLNVHPSLLPMYRGGDPVRAQILCDDRDTGVTVHVIDERCDHGPILAQKKVPSGIWPPAASVLGPQLAIEGGRLLAEVLPDWMAGKIQATPQQEAANLTTTQSILKTYPRQIDPALPAEEQWRRFRAYGTDPGVFYTLESGGTARTVHVTRAYYRNNAFVVASVSVDGAESVSYEHFLHEFDLVEDPAWNALSAQCNSEVHSASDSAHSDKLLRIRESIFTDVVVDGNNERIVNPNGTEQSGGWLLDFRNILLDSEKLDLIAEVFWERYEHAYPFQVGGQEVAAIPLVCAIVLKGHQRGKPINGFFTRKSRKKTGLQKLIEGRVTEERIILVDDLMNFGSTQVRQIKALENEGHTVSEVFVIVQFRDTYEYRYLLERDIRISSLFRPVDFGLQLSQRKDGQKQPSQLFKIQWKFQSSDPDHFHIVPKSAPVIDETNVYFGADNGTFWALNQHDGSVKWKFKIWRKTKGKAIYSAPALHDDTVYFGAYDGNVYALNTKDGSKKWSFWEADWVGSSPALAPDINTLFIGLEFGLFTSKGGIAALDMKNGSKKWEYSMSGLTHSSPAYSQKLGVVGIGCNNHTFYLFNARKGTLLWEYETGAEIRASTAFDPKRGYVLFGSFDGNIYICDVKTGAVVHTFKTESPVYSTPLVVENRVYITSMDKRLYCIDLDSFEELWRFETAGRIFSNATVINDRIYVGSNDGFLYELNSDGRCNGFFAAGERIVNKPAYNVQNNRYFLLTHANELYSLQRCDKIET